MGRTLRIAQIAPIVERLPPKKYGGTERVIYHLTEALVRRGHDVTLFATGDTKTSARLVSVVPRGLREMPGERDIYGFNGRSLLNMGTAYAMAGEFDIIHDHSPHMGFPTANVCATPSVMTWHGPYDRAMTEFFGTLTRPHLVAISYSQARLAPALRFAGTVYNGLPMEHYPFSDAPEEYLLYVGRIDAEKGVHLAMDAAVRLGMKLVIAAKLDAQVPHIGRYFEAEVRPRLDAHPELLSWIGEVDETARNALMKNAKAFLHAVQWPEPFGLALIEAMACGCPVVAFRNGAIPEIVAHGKTGFVVGNLDEMVEAVRQIGAIDRRACRAHALAHFSAERMAAGYEEVYDRVLKTNRPAERAIVARTPVVR